MTALSLTCRVSGKTFVVSDEDQAFYAKMGVPLPTLSPEERLRRRLSFRNERKLYHRKCDLCQKQIISVYRANTTFPVYCEECFWSDHWDAGSFGSSFDFNRTFFDQFKELQEKVPHLALVHPKSENCTYTNCVSECKDCYLCFDVGSCENCLYLKTAMNVKNCVDLAFCYDNCQYCYECLNCYGCYETIFAVDSRACNNSAFLYDCRNCSDCLFCTNLRNKQFCINNQQYSKEEYEKYKQEILPILSHQKLEKLLTAFDTLMLKAIHPHIQQENCENSLGDYLRNCKNCHSCFGCTKSEDSAYMLDSHSMKNSMDSDFAGIHENSLLYETIGCAEGYDSQFLVACWNPYDCQYCQTCMFSKHLLGCISIRNDSYVILNKKYSEEEYSQLKIKITEHMQRTGEWGEFFPKTMSPFAYNETVAQDYFPMTPDQISAAGLMHYDEATELSYVGPDIEIPDSINDVDASILTKILKCEDTGKFYKIISQEYEFYKKMGLPIPHKSPDQRYKNRFSRRKVLQLWSRICSGCFTNIQSSYESSRKEKVYCEACYLKLVY